MWMFQLFNPTKIQLSSYLQNSWPRWRGWQSQGGSGAGWTVSPCLRSCWESYLKSDRPLYSRPNKDSWFLVCSRIQGSLNSLVVNLLKDAFILLSTFPHLYCLNFKNHLSSLTKSSVTLSQPSTHPSWSVSTMFQTPHEDKGAESSQKVQNQV